MKKKSIKKTQTISTRLVIFILALIVLAIYIDLPKSPGIHVNLGPIQINRDFKTRYGLDLVGGVQALLEADVPADTKVDPGAMSSARSIVERRVNGMGVNETVVQQAGDRRILVELPGETDPQQALASLQKTGLLEFVDFSSVPVDQAAAMEGQTVVTDYGQPAAGESPAATPQVTPEATPSTVPPAGANAASTIYHTVMTGAELKTVGVTRSQAGQYEVGFELSSDGAKTFADFTRAHTGQVLAIVLDKQVISAPRINNAITDGRGVITGRFTTDTANALAVQLRYGSLPIPLKVASSQTVGPTLGQDSLRKSAVAGLIGLSAVALFMAAYYRLPGVLADVALLVYALLTLAVFKWIGVTLTLPGIAGFVLSIGVAVDANILIFSRTREELRAGRTLRQAIDLGWSRAWPSIRDSNFSTLITCFILFWFGSAFGASIVKGFSLTLAIGVLISMFTAIIVTRTFLHIVLDNVEFAKHPKWFGAGTIQVGATTNASNR